MTTTIAERLQEAFNQSDYRSWAAVSRAANLKSGSTIYDLLKGRTGSESPNITRIAYVLGVNALWLQHGRGEKRSMSALINVNALPVEVNPRSESLDREILRDISELIRAYSMLTARGRWYVLRTAREAEREAASELPPKM